MAQLQLSVPKDVADGLEAQAQARGLSVSAYLAQVAQRRAAWPKEFFSKVIGGWQGTPLKRPRQRRHERRDQL